MRKLMLKRKVQIPERLAIDRGTWLSIGAATDSRKSFCFWKELLTRTRAMTTAGQHYICVFAENSVEETRTRLPCTAHDVTVVKLLLATGADINIQDRFGRTPLHFGYHAIVRSRSRDFSLTMVLVFMKGTC
jgi:hypothetical protein